MEDNPNKNIFLYYFGFLFSIFCLWGLLISGVGELYHLWQENLSEGQIRAIESVYISTSAPIIRDNTLIGICSLETPNVYVLGSLTDRIIFCESSGDARAYNPKSGAKGLLQIIPSSERFCEKGLGRELDMFNPADNLACGEYLYQHGKLSHWKSSARCWAK